MITALLSPIDTALNKVTMYMQMQYVLAGFVVSAAVLAQVGLIGVSAGGIVLSAAVLLGASFIAQQLFVRLYNAQTNKESWIITALILVFLLPPIDSVERAVLTALCAALAIASKFIITWRGAHIFNPVAIAAVFMSVTGLLPITWWVASPWMTTVVALAGVMILRKHQHFLVFMTFAISAVGLMLLQQSVLGSSEPLQVLWFALTSWPIVFLGVVMLTEPLTMPGTKTDQLLFTAIVGVLFGLQLRVGPVSLNPHTALVLGNIFACIVGYQRGATVRVASTKRLANELYEVQTSKPATLAFSAGQYAFVTLPHARADARGTRRMVSIAAAPNDAVLRFIMRLPTRSSTFKREFSALKTGDTLRVANPSGDFVLPSDQNTPVLLIAGGVGITPIIAMALSNTSRDIVVLYYAHTKDEHIYKQQLQAAPNVAVVFKTGHFTSADVQEHAADYAKRRVYVSGPPAMVVSTKSQLMKLGVKRRSIVTDSFSGY